MSEPEMNARAEELFQEERNRILRRTDKMFARLMFAQYLFAVGLAVIVTPHTWAGEEKSVHPHLYAAIGLGFVFTIFPVGLGTFRTGETLTRHVIAASQMLMSALFIHLTQGRIETHFHVFGGLAILAFYRDTRVLITATLVVYVDHLARGFWYPQSVYGVLTSTPWRSFEHAGWVLFEVAFLIRGSARSIDEMKQIALNQMELETSKASVEREVEQRTEQLRGRTEELEEEVKRRKELESQLVQAQKMESVGQLASGVAHEINTPTQYVGDNVRFFKEGFGSLLDLREKYRDVIREGNADEERLKALLKELEEIDDEIDLEYLLEEVPRAFDQTLDGIERIADIVRSMKSFAHPGATEKEKVNLGEAVETVVTVATNEWKYLADVEVRIPQDLPDLPAYPGEFNQVLLNLLVNAAHAVKDAVAADKYEKGNIEITAERDGDDVVLTVKDDALGIPEDIRSKIFDPFFTTKEVGKGTGQGLTLAHNVVVRKHGGSLHFETKEGSGTTFFLRLPL